LQGDDRLYLEPATGMSTIELIGISKRYGSVTAVEATDLRIEQGEMLTLLGPSGSGKSTILSMIAGLTSPSSGRIRFGNRDVTDTPPARRNLGLVFQSYALFPHMTVYDNVAFPLGIRGVAKSDVSRRVNKALAQVRLGGLELRRPAQLSGGQQQRVALARALVFEPDILLLDEPLGALDKKLREEVQLELRQLQRNLGVTTVLVTHDQEEALSLSTRLAVLDQGRIQQLDTPLGAYQRPCNQFVAKFIGTANLFEGEVETTDDHEVRLRSGETVHCLGGHGLSGRVDLLVRPEHLRCLTPDEPGGIEATVIENVYIGQSTRMHLQADSGKSLVAVGQTGCGLNAPGGRVRIGWAPEHGWLMQA
jgi:putative spermidine/putrescine transport system ATP-binding protein